MLWVKDTLLCPECDKLTIYDIMGAFTKSEIYEWLKKNRTY